MKMWETSKRVLQTKKHRHLESCHDFYTYGKCKNRDSIAAFSTIQFQLARIWPKVHLLFYSRRGTKRSTVSMPHIALNSVLTLVSKIYNYPFESSFESMPETFNYMILCQEVLKFCFCSNSLIQIRKLDWIIISQDLAGALRVRGTISR